MPREKICKILRLKCTKFDFGWGSAPDPVGVAHSAPPDPVAGFKGPTSKGKWRGRERKGERCKGRGKGGRTTCVLHFYLALPSAGSQFQGEPLQRGHKVQGVVQFCDFRLKSPSISKTGRDCCGFYRTLMRSIEWWHFQWPWRTLTRFSRSRHWPLTGISRSRYFSVLDISETTRDRAI